MLPPPPHLLHLLLQRCGLPLHHTPRVCQVTEAVRALSPPVLSNTESGQQLRLSAAHLTSDHLTTSASPSSPRLCSCTKDELLEAVFNAIGGAIIGGVRFASLAQLEAVMAERGIASSPDVDELKFELRLEIGRNIRAQVYARPHRHADNLFSLRNLLNVSR